MIYGGYDPKCLKALHNTVHWKRRIRVTAIEGSNPREMTQRRDRRGSYALCDRFQAWAEKRPRC